MVLRRLGRGATGQLYLAEDSVLARPVAIEFIGADPDPAARQRFLMEARAAARIQHPNVISIYWRSSLRAVTSSRRASSSR